MFLLLLQKHHRSNNKHLRSLRTHLQTNLLRKSEGK
jgi:hypothetical protein